MSEVWKGDFKYPFDAQVDKYVNTIVTCYGNIVVSTSTKTN